MFSAGLWKALMLSISHLKHWFYVLFLFHYNSAFENDCIILFIKGIFREDDLEHFDEDFRSNFQKRQADIFSEEGWGDDE